MIKNIEVTARTEWRRSCDPTLYDAIQKAKKNSVPADNIRRAVNVVAVLKPVVLTMKPSCIRVWSKWCSISRECLTDNRNRAASDVRVALSIHW